MNITIAVKGVIIFMSPIKYFITYSLNSANTVMNIYDWNKFDELQFSDMLSN